MLVMLLLRMAGRSNRPRGGLDGTCGSIDRLELRSALALQCLHLHHVLALYHLLLRDMCLFGLLLHFHVIALQRLQLLISTLLERLKLCGVLTLEILLTRPIGCLLQLLCMLALQRLKLLGMLVG